MMKSLQLKPSFDIDHTAGFAQFEKEQSNKSQFVIEQELTSKGVSEIAAFFKAKQSTDIGNNPESETTKKKKKGF